MEPTIGIVTDSSCDLPDSVVEEFGIEVVPLTVHFGTEVYPDRMLSDQEFWAKAAGPHHPKTSQPTLGAFEEAYERLLSRCQQVLCVTLTSKHSGTFNAATLAAQRFGNLVEVFDSHSLSLGLGIQTLLAAQAAYAGQPMQELLALVGNLRGRMKLTIALDTLENLRRGGRADGFIAVADRMTRALNIKVIINLVEGQLRLVSAARSFKGALQRLKDSVEQMAPLEHLAVVHTRNEDTANYVARELAERIGFPRERIWVRETGAVLAVHAGPGVIGVLAVPQS